jgi:hypothetical protein
MRDGNYREMPSAAAAATTTRTREVQRKPDPDNGEKRVTGLGFQALVALGSRLAGYESGNFSYPPGVYCSSAWRRSAAGGWRQPPGINQC